MTIHSSRWRMLLVMGMAVAQAAATARAQHIVAQAGDPAPGGGTMTGMFRAVIGSEGHIAFLANTENPKAVIAVFGMPGKPGSPATWQRGFTADVPVPGALQESKLILSLTTNLWITPSGRLVAYMPVWLKRPGYSRADALLASDGQTMQVIAFQDQPMAPPNSEYLQGTFRHDVRGEFIAYGIQGRKGENPEPGGKRDFVFVTKAGQTPEVVAAHGDDIHGIQAKIDLGGIGLKRVGVTEHGDVFFVDAIGPNHKAILTAPHGKPPRVVLEAGGPSPLPDRKFDGFSQVSAAAGTLAFHAEFGSTNLRDYSKVHGCCFRDAKGKVHVIAKGGDPLPGHDDVAIDHHQPLFTPIVSGNGRFVLVQTILTRPAPNKHGREAVLLFDTESEKLATVIYAGMPAPSPHESLAFDQFKDVAFNSAGHVAFRSMDAVWAGAPGRLRRVAAKGEPLAIGDRTLHPRNVSLSGRYADTQSSLNDQGSLVVQIDDKGHGDLLVLFQVD